MVYHTWRAAVERSEQDAIVFVRHGDFYVTYDEQAKTVARVWECYTHKIPVGSQRHTAALVSIASVQDCIGALHGAGLSVALVE